MVDWVKVNVSCSTHIERHVQRMGAFGSHLEGKKANEDSNMNNNTLKNTYKIVDWVRFFTLYQHGM